MRQETIHSISYTRNMKKEKLYGANRFLARKLQVHTKSYNPMEFAAMHKVAKIINEKISQLKIPKVSGISVATKGRTKWINKNEGGEMNG